MTEIPVEHGLLFAAALFCIGLVGVLVRRNLVFMLMSLELMLNATAFVFVLGGALHGNADGQVMFVMILTLAAAEVAVGLALVVHLYHRHRSLDADRLDVMKG
ncbi:MAG: NADH-quinone oxidoreductase subunit NuoK [Oceanospirillaceae bacterium]|nr:NADH-quinone oxidoreductase subunit NuoK [Oceanospirillaceae bacterium]